MWSQHTAAATGTIVAGCGNLHRLAADFDGIMKDTDDIAARRRPAFSRPLGLARHVL